MADSSTQTVQDSNAKGSPGLFAAIKARLSTGDLGLLPVGFALVVIWIVFEAMNSHFLSARNLSNLTEQIVVIGTLAVGVTFVLLLGEIDLSIAAVDGVAAGLLVTIATGWTNPMGAVAAMSIAIFVGLVIGLFQGYWVTVIGVHALIITLAGSLAYQGILIGILSDGTKPIINPTLSAISTTYLPAWLGWVLAALVVIVFSWLKFGARKRRVNNGLEIAPLNLLFVQLGFVVLASVVVVGVLNSYKGVPLLALIMAIIVVVAGFFTKYTRYGFHIFALGGNAEAARRAGIKVNWIKISCFTIAGGLAGVAGILGAARLGSASPATGTGDLLLLSIAAAIIGGTSLFGGRGSVYNALAGALVLGSVENGMDLLSAPSSTKYIVEGGILFIAVTIDTLSRKRRKNVGKQ